LKRRTLENNLSKKSKQSEISFGFYTQKYDNAQLFVGENLKANISAHQKI
jgi:hypothetical protein